MVVEVFFDAETEKLFNEIQTNDPADLGISVVSCLRRVLSDDYSEQSSDLVSFWKEDMGKMWDWFYSADRIIGFNSMHFDVPLLSRYAPYSFSDLHHFDILEEVKKAVGKRLSLNVLARDTLGKLKTDKGTNAVYYWKKGDSESLKKLQMYCEHDVLITKELYDFGLKHGYVQYKDKWNNMQQVAVQFTRVPMLSTKITENQLDLF